MSYFKIGQRFLSETEPELGLGTISFIENKIIRINFIAAKTERSYGVNSAPLKRVVFSKEDEITLRSGKKLTVSERHEVEGLFHYIATDGENILETEISDVITFNKPEDRIFNGSIDNSALFNLRNKTLFYKNRILKNPVRGFIGGRMSLIPHQFYVAHKIANRPIPRVLLADEVGLGKTIEAGLTLHHLILSERVKRALIIVPDSLVYQWFIEMLKKFNLTFTTFNQETHLEPGTNPFSDNDFVIVNIGLLKGAKIARDFLAEVKWDLLVVDEAHQLKWSEKEISLEYKLVEEISKTSKGLLLLTATPEQLGLEGHFARLKLIDPNRFFDYQKFLEENAHYEEIAKLANELHLKTDGDSVKKLNDLQDRHGTGRIFIRNTRKRMSDYFSFFPKRVLKSYPLESKKTNGLGLEDDEVIGPTFDLKLDWLVKYLNENKNEKILLITKSKTKVLCLEKLLKEKMPGLNIAVFHSSLSFVARDRQAAYFKEPNGAQILLCTEVGSEGRNFEFAHELILFDLPNHPDLLEQRIGRLDRIGQKKDIIIHVPFVLNSYEEILYLWYSQGINAFSHSAKGASLVYQQLHSLLQEYLLKPELVLKNTAVLEKFLETTKEEYRQVGKKLEDGRDILVELNSFEEKEALRLIKEINDFDTESYLPQYMNEVFSELGIDVEDLDENIFYIRPSDNMYVPHFPGLDIDGKRITFDREVALKREDVEFLTWDHPMVVSTIDMILSNAIGNASVMMRKNKGNGKTFIEAFYRLEIVAPKHLTPDRFFPTTIIRVLLDSSGENFSAKWSKEDIDEKIMDADVDHRTKAKNLPKVAVLKILKEAHQLAKNDSSEIIKHYKEKMIENLTLEKDRLIRLKEINPIIRIEEIDAISIQQMLLSKSFDNADVTLDSIRIIF